MAAQLRVATEADITEMHRIRLDVRENRLVDAARVQPEHYRAMIREDGRGWVSVEDGRMLGFAVADLRRSNIWALFVAPEAEGRGVGRKLHDAMLEWLFGAGAQRVTLSTDPGTRAERFYRAAGWQPTGSEEGGEVGYEMERERWLVRAPHGPGELPPPP